jgi:hypothetical protein
VLGLPRRDEPEDHRRLSLSLAKKAAAFLRISRSSVSVSDLTAQAAHLVALVGGQAIGLALVDVELARPVAQRLRRAPKLLASCEIDRPVVCSRRTASRRNSSRIRRDGPHGHRSSLPGQTAQRSSVHETVKMPEAFPFGSDLP